MVKLPSHLLELVGKEHERKIQQAAAHRVPCPAPVVAVLVLLNRCNASCRYCLWEQDAINPARKGSYLPTVRAIEIVEELARLGVRYLHLTGGEPTLHEGLTDIIAAGATAKMHVNVVTNGIWSDKHFADSLANAGLGSLGLSLDTVDPELHKRVRGNPVPDFIRLGTIARHLHNRGVWTGVNAVLHEQSEKHLHDLIEWCSENKISIQFQPLQVKDGIHELENDPALLSNQVQILRACKRAGAPIINSEAFLERLKVWRNTSPRHCHVPWTQVVIYPDERVGFCCLHDPYTKLPGRLVSSVVGDSIEASRARKDLIGQGCPPCSLYWTDGEK